MAHHRHGQFRLRGKPLPVDGTASGSIDKTYFVRLDLHFTDPRNGQSVDGTSVISQTGGRGVEMSNSFSSTPTVTQFKGDMDPSGSIFDLKQFDPPTSHVESSSAFPPARNDRGRLGWLRPHRILHIHIGRFVTRRDLPGSNRSSSRSERSWVKDSLLPFENWTTLAAMPIIQVMTQSVEQIVKDHLAARARWTEESQPGQGASVFATRRNRQERPVFFNRTCAPKRPR